MKLVLFMFFGVFLHLAVTGPVLDKQVEIPMVYDDKQDPHLWQSSGKFEGDMILTPEQEKRLRKDSEHENGVIDIRLRWPSRKIPYEISEDFTASEKDYIESVIKDDYARTCIQVVRRTNEDDYVYITSKGPGCYSEVGRIGGKQRINLSRNGCLHSGTIVHEFLHAAGFYHMHSAPERDDFVSIQWQNIDSSKKDQFDKYESNVVSSSGQRYDYGSVMHYDPFAFSKNGEKTIEPKDPNAKIGQATKLSPIDIAKLNRMYGCSLSYPQRFLLPDVKCPRNKIPIAHDNHQDPQLWQKSGKVEGDMVLTPEQQERLYKDKESRNGVIDTRLRWPNRRVPYEISNDFTVSERNYITAVLNEDYARSCVKVVPRTNEADYVYGQNTGCWSWVGRLGGRQELNFQRNGCVLYSTIVHEFLHAAGFYHMHSATERDDYVTIQWGNIQSGEEQKFQKYGTDMISSFGQRYDYYSLMHYDAYAFSKNGQKTIVPRQDVEIGIAQKLSTTDITKLNLMYGC